MFLDGRCDPGPLLSYSRVAPVSFEEVLPFWATPVCNRPVSGSFHPPSGVLFSFPSRYVVRYRSRDVFRLGGRCPPASRGISDPRYSGIFAHSPPGLRLRGYHPLRRAFPGHFGFPGETAAKPYNTTSPQGFPWGFGLASPGFGRPYSRDPYWFLFLRLLRCFSSAGSRPHTGTLELIRLQQEVPFGHPRFYGCMRLAGAYRSLPRPSSAPEPSHPPGGVRVPGPTWETHLAGVPAG